MTSAKKPKVVLITGAARRIGKSIAEMLHAKGMRVILHYQKSAIAAHALCRKLNAQRADSACTVQGDLTVHSDLVQLLDKAINAWGYLDALVNNASAYFPTPMGEVNEADWEYLFAANLKAPFFLSQLAAPWLARRKGCIINLGDIHAQKPLKNYPVYSMTKAGIIMMTQSLAKELAPHIRVNAVSPGEILWPEGKSAIGTNLKTDIIKRIALGRIGDPLYIAQAVLFLIESGDYITGQVIAVDGGRLLNC